jgi:hypothetical protein
MRNHRLVGRNQRAASAQRFARQRQRGAIGTADQFNNHVYIGRRC